MAQKNLIDNWKNQKSQDSKVILFDIENNNYCSVCNFSTCDNCPINEEKLMKDINIEYNVIAW